MVFSFVSPFAFLPQHPQKGRIVCALALAEADRKIQRLLRVGRHMREGEGNEGDRERNNINILVRKISYCEP